ncbi:MAG: peroxide stress protein YaaA, partial [Cetobacterium sp.]
LDMTNKILDISPYAFWNESIENFLLPYKDEIFVNIASKEFSKILNRKLFNVVDIEFRQIVDGKIKNISTEAKKARGAMLNYLIQIKADNVSQIKDFDRLGYEFSKEDSSESEFIFLKK